MFPPQSPTGMWTEIKRLLLSELTSFENVVFADDDSKSVIAACSFKTLPPAFDLDTFCLFDEDGEEKNEFADLATGSFTLTANIKNNRCEDAQSFIATICVYNSKNQLCAISGGEASLNKGESKEIEIKNFAMEENETYTAKCFVWDSFTGMNKIYEKEIR